MKSPKSNKMTCIHGLGSSVVDYVIFDIPISNQIINFDLLNYHEHDSDHRHLTLILNFFMEMSAIENNSNNQRKLVFEKSKFDILLKYLNRELLLLSYKDNIEYLYHNFTTTISTSINKFSFELSCKNNNRTTNSWYDKECKIYRNSIRDASNYSLKLNNINTHKSLIKMEKRCYMNKMKEKLSQLSKLDPKKF